MIIGLMKELADCGVQYLQNELVGLNWYCN